MPDTNMIPQSTRIKAANPDIILCQSDGASSGVIAKNYRQLGMKSRYLPPSVATPDFFRIGGACRRKQMDLYDRENHRRGADAPGGHVAKDPLRAFQKDHAGEIWSPTAQRLSLCCPR